MKSDDRIRWNYPVPLQGLMIVLAALVVYGPALSGDVLWDDDQYVSANPLLFADGGLWRIWTSPEDSPQYYPLVFTSFWLEARLWGLSTFGLHLVNVALHALNAILLWFVLRRLRVPGAWLAGAMFALHPVNVESVAWITERKNVLSGLFFLLSIAAYSRFTDQRSWWRYGLAFALFICALLSKTAICFLPVVLLLLHWWKQPRIGRRDVLGLLPFFGIAVVFGLATVAMEKYEVGAIGEAWSLTWLQRILLANRALWFYAGKLLWPANLAFNYPRWAIDPTVWWQYAFPALTVAAAVVLWRLRERIGQAPLVALGCFVAGIAPVLGFFDVYYFRYSYVADHFLYHAGMGFIALIAAVLTLVPRWLDERADRSRQLFAHVAFVVPVIFGVLSFRQAGVYTDIETLWRQTLAQNPSSMLAHHELGLLLVRGHEDDPAVVREAKEHFRAILRTNPHSIDAHQNLGTLASRCGRHDEAIAHYQAVLRIDPADTAALYSLGRELERTSDIKGAIAAYRTCLDVDSECTPAHSSLGRIFLARGEHQRAAEHFRLACESDPGNAAALRNLGMVYEDGGRYVEAIGHYRKALAIDPAMAEVWFRTGVCLRKTGDVAGAEAAYRRSLELNPTYADALVDLAVLDYGAGRFEQAVSRYRRALALNPNDAFCRVNLAMACRQLADDAGAIAALEDGLQNQPDNLNFAHALANLLATTSDPNVRDGARAVELAKRVVERLEPPMPRAFATLAAAYAEVRAYDRAVEAANRAIELARARSMIDLEKELAEQLREYNARRMTQGGN